jgi:Fe-S cluster assembly scaffold protein SufB
MNKYASLDKDMQYEFLLNSLRQRKRFSPWLRKDKISDLDYVKRYYGYSNEKASQALKLLSPEQIEFIKQRLDTGGKK